MSGSRNRIYEAPVVMDFGPLVKGFGGCQEGTTAGYGGPKEDCQNGETAGYPGSGDCQAGTTASGECLIGDAGSS